MHTIQRTLSLLFAAAALSATLHAQDKLKDGTSLTWDKTIGVGQDSLMNDTVMVPARTVPVYEADDSQVAKLLEKVIPGSSFKKAGQIAERFRCDFPGRLGKSGATAGGHREGQEGQPQYVEVSIPSSRNPFGRERREVERSGA
ncbi:MAG: hypothetical protein IPL81_06195 [Flavobacteriales bacterium]|nr:hypothetical protein [Flavobacteriales bacterium]